MRTALLSAVKRTETGQLRAELLLAGRSVLAWQGTLARDLGCERIICLCDAPGEAVLALQQEVECAGAEFHAIRNNLQLVSLMRADDELVMMLDGLLPDPATVLGFAGVGPESGATLNKGIATIAAGHTLSESGGDDFERIDRYRHWAGVAVIRANQVQKLADLPPDGDAMSILLRLALQARVECRDLPATSLSEERWGLAGRAETLAKREQKLLSASAVTPVWTGPGRALAAFFVKQLAPRGLETGAEMSAAVSAVLMVTGLGLAALGYGAAGLGFAAVGAVAGAVCKVWSVVRERLWSVKSNFWIRKVLNLAIDITALIALILTYGWQVNPITQIALPLFAIGLARLAGRENDGAGGGAQFWRDRAVHLAAFAIAAATGYLGECLAIFATAALAQLTLRR